VRLASAGVLAERRVDGLPARDRFIADSAAASALLLRAVGDAKRKPLTGVGRQLDDRSWVIADTSALHRRRHPGRVARVS